MRLLSFTCFLGLLLLSSCEDLANLGIVIPKVVIDTRVEAGKSPEVTVRVVDQYGQTLRSYDLESSTVTLQQDQSEAIVFGLTASSDSSATFSSDCIIEANTRYTLLINSPDLDEVRSITDVPDAVSVIVQDPSGEFGPKGGLLPKDNVFHLPLSFSDVDIGLDNRYHLVVTVIDLTSPESAVDPLEITFGLFPPPSDVSRFNDTGWMFSDKDFRDGIFSAVVLINKEDVVQFAEPSVNVEIRSVSVDYFNFHRQNSRPKSSTLIDLSISGSNNVEGGTGLFGGVASTNSTFLLEFR
ncbi:MAG: DUF4249 family protein [Saprospiraceae bacterium]